MTDIAMGLQALRRQQYERSIFGRNAEVPAEPVEPAPAPEAPVTPTVEISPYAGFGGVISALGMDTFMPPGTSAADTINQSLQLTAPYILNPELAAQLIGNQTQEPPSQEAVAGAMEALSQKYDVDDPIKLFKQIQIPGAGQIQPWDLQRAVTAGGGTIEQASALMKQLDPFNNGAITIQQFMANLPGAEPAAAPAPETAAPAIVDNTSLGGLAALATKYNISQPPQDLFLELDTDFDGMLSQTDIVNAVMAGGGSAEAGASLYAQLDPSNAGWVTQGQFANNFYPRIEMPNIFV